MTMTIMAPNGIQNLSRRGVLKGIAGGLVLAAPLLIHHESKSRGMALSSRQREEALAAARQVWRDYRPWMADDPCYSPCLSLERAWVPAFAPRRRLRWARRRGRRGRQPTRIKPGTRIASPTVEARVRAPG